MRLAELSERSGVPTATARAEVAALLTELGWTTTLELGELSPVHRSPVASVATLIRLGYPCDIGYLTRQARIMEQAAVHDPDEMETYASEAEQVEKAVASAVWYEPLPMSLRRPAQSEESARRYGL